jgi:hypothetical protein
VTSYAVLRLTKKIAVFSNKLQLELGFYIDHEDVSKASLKWHEIDIWPLTHKAETIIFRRMKAYSFVVSQGGGDATAVVTPAGYSRRSESASSDRLSRFPSVLILQPYSLCDLIRKISQIHPSWNHSEAEVWFIAPVLHDWAWQLTTSVLGFWRRVSSWSVQTCDKARGKRRAIPIHARTGPEGFRRLRLPDFKTIGTLMWQGCQPYAPVAFTPQKIFQVLISVGARGGAVVETERFQPCSCEGWRLFWRPIKLIYLYLLFCLFSGTIHLTF